MNTITVLRYGTQVRLKNVDLYGYLGRGLHPKACDAGFLGTVVANSVVTMDAEGFILGFKENVLGGTEFVDDPDHSTADICYKVRASDGRELELMAHEIEVFS
jgi:hypothetical protein